jgi:hypothetical protein
MFTRRVVACREPSPIKLILCTSLVLLLFNLTSSFGQKPDAWAGLSDGKRLRAARLQLQADVALDWQCDVSHASKQQREKLSTKLSEHVLAIARQASWRAEDFKLALFVGNRAKPGRVLLEGRPWKATKSDWQNAVASCLDEQQLQLLNTTLKDREMFLGKQAIEAHLAYLEKLAGLSQNDRKALRDRLTTDYQKQVLAKPLCIENLRELRLLDDDIIRRTLADRAPRLQRILMNGGGRDIGFRTHVSLDIPTKWKLGERENAIAKSIKQSVGYLEREHEALVALVTGRFELGARQRRRLELACKGIRTKVYRKWRSRLASAVTAFEESEDEGFDRSVSLSFQAQPLQDDPLWSRTLNAILKDPKNQLAGIKSEFIRQGAVSQAFVAFDRELWLQDDQREPFKQLLNRAVTGAGPALSRLLLSRFLSNAAKEIPLVEAEKFLSVNQIRVLKLIQNPPEVSHFETD